MHCKVCCSSRNIYLTRETASTFTARYEVTVKHIRIATGKVSTCVLCRKTSFGAQHLCTRYRGFEEAVVAAAMSA